MTSATRKDLLPIAATGFVASLVAVKFLVHFYASFHDNYFRDEMYYLACSRHLDWGYVDQPPLIAFIAWLVRSTIGQSVPAIRLLPAIAGACEVGFSAVIARELGGGRIAQGLAALATLAAGGILSIDSFLSMNAFEPLFWTGCAYLVIRIIKTGDQKLWIWFGVVAGFGLENKHSMLIFGAGLMLGLLLTPARKVFATPWIWIGGAIAFLIFLPNLWWNIQHHFPFIELQMNIRRAGRDVALSPLAFLGQEILTMGPLSLPTWAAGLWFYFSSRGKEFRALGIAWIFTAVVIMAVSPRIYYLYPAFPILFAAGGVFWEAQIHWRWYVWPRGIAISAIVATPFAIPILPPQTFIRYSKLLHFGPPAIETHKLGPLPQVFADHFGWEEMTAEVARVYNSLSPEIRLKTAIFAANYGEAGAIDLFGPKYGLPPAISGHQNYFFWGPRDYTGVSMIVMNIDPKELEQEFASVQKVGHVDNPYSMPFEHFDIYYCQGLKRPLSEVWPQVKRWS